MVMYIFFCPCGFRVVDLREAPRCFNCGSYNHPLSECQKPRDNAAVNSARKQYLSKRNQNTGPRVQTRYYQESPAGKFDGLKPGALSAETRKLLGLGVRYTDYLSLLYNFIYHVIFIYSFAFWYSFYHYPFCRCGVVVDLWVCGMQFSSSISASCKFLLMMNMVLVSTATLHSIGTAV